MHDSKTMARRGRVLLRVPIVTHVAWSLLILGTVSSPPVQAGFIVQTIVEDGGVGDLDGRFDFPTSVVKAPDGRICVTDRGGNVQVFAVNPAGVVTAVQSITTLADSGRELIGIAFHPVTGSMYLSHTASDETPDEGMITVLSGPGYSIRTDLITGLPNALHHHNTESLLFLQEDGRVTLLISQGSMTNYGGTPGDFWEREELPLSGAILQADVTDDILTGEVTTYATGLRNAYDLVLHSNGRIYATDNGGFPFGTTPQWEDCLDPDPDSQPLEDPDALSLIVEGSFHGIANRSRGECDFISNNDDTKIPGVNAPANYVPAVFLFEPPHTSTNGITEIAGTNTCFDGELWTVYTANNDAIVRLELSVDGTTVVDSGTLPIEVINPLDIYCDPDTGHIWIIDNIAYAGVPPGQATLKRITIQIDPGDFDCDDDVDLTDFAKFQICFDDGAGEPTLHCDRVDFDGDDDVDLDDFALFQLAFTGPVR